MPDNHIHVATCKRGGKKDPHFYASGVVVTDGYKGWIDLTVQTADTREEAIAGVVARIQGRYRRQGLPVPVSITDHGNLPRVDVESSWHGQPIFALRVSPWK